MRGEADVQKSFCKTIFSSIFFFFPFTFTYDLNEIDSSYQKKKKMVLAIQTNARLGIHMFLLHIHFLAFYSN